MTAVGHKSENLIFSSSWSMRLSHKIPPLHGAWPPYGLLRVLAWELNFHLARPHHAWLPVQAVHRHHALQRDPGVGADEPQIDFAIGQDDDGAPPLDHHHQSAACQALGCQPFQDREIRLGAPGLGDGGGDMHHQKARLGVPHHLADAGVPFPAPGRIGPPAADEIAAEGGTGRLNAATAKSAVSTSLENSVKTNSPPSRRHVAAARNTACRSPKWISVAAPRMAS